MEHDTAAVGHGNGLNGALDIAAVGICRRVEGGGGKSSDILGTAGVVVDGLGVSKCLRSKFSAKYAPSEPNEKGPLTPVVILSLESCAAPPLMATADRMDAAAVMRILIRLDRIPKSRVRCDN